MAEFNRIQTFPKDLETYIAINSDLPGFLLKIRVKYMCMFVCNIHTCVFTHTPQFVVVTTVRNLISMANKFLTLGQLLFSQYVCHIGYKVINMIRSLLHKYGTKLRNVLARLECVAMSEGASFISYTLNMCSCYQHQTAGAHGPGNPPHPMAQSAFASESPFLT